MYDFTVEYATAILFLSGLLRIMFPILPNAVVICKGSSESCHLPDFFRNISSEKYGAYFIFSVKLTLAMQIIGFSVRLSSSLLWIQIYRLGASYIDTPVPRESDSDLRTSFLSPPTPAVARQSSGSDEVLGGSIYDPAYYSSLFEDGRENKYSLRGQNHAIDSPGSASAADISPLKLSLGRSFKSLDGQNYAIGGNGSTPSADASPLKLCLARSFQSGDFPCHLMVTKRKSACYLWCVVCFIVELERKDICS
ncbi:hypothetical protein TIFTF001_018781 [Ficus carica]|uniref:Uncharacterized protein n=1 Tax=Ficus carica TaxID=3494 RepID=A0AA88D894_FICCA|nr:hypothetical protein TIFTF001_018781 [Ficus carica]